MIQNTAPTSESADSTQPGPFQKYLFSGACFVQLGHCVALVNRCLEQNMSLAEFTELRDECLSIWKTYLSQQPAFVLTEFINQLDADTTCEQKSLLSFYQELEAAGKEAVDQFIESISRHAQSELDVKQFFTDWALSCESAYSELVRTESFAQSIGSMMNAALHDHSDTA